MMINQSIEKLRAMKLPAMAAEYTRQTESPAMGALDFDERMGMLVDAEWLSRENNRIRKLTKVANLRFSSACFADIDYRPSRKLERHLIARLSGFTWVKEARNLIVTGATGCGKTWLVCAFGVEACRMGFSVSFYRTNVLLGAMAQAADSGTITKFLEKLQKTDILILDDWGLSTLNPLESRFLLEIFEARYKENSTIFSAQVPVAKWHDLFEDSTVADAVLDRVVHNSYRITLYGRSMRALINESNYSNEENEALDGTQSQNTYSPDGDQSQNTYPLDGDNEKTNPLTGGGNDD